MVADGRDDGGDVFRFHAFLREDAHGHERPALGVVMTVDDVANIVHEACDARDLHIMLAVIEIFQDLSGHRSHMGHVGKAVLRKAHAHQCAVGFFDVNADRRIVFDVFKSDLQSNQLLFF